MFQIHTGLKYCEHCTVQIKYFLDIFFTKGVIIMNYEAYAAEIHHPFEMYIV